MNHLKKTDPEIEQLIKLESKRQKEGLEMIPSENYVSPAVLEAMGSILTNKYSEGYPHKRYYGGNECIDEVELLAQERAKKLFKVPYVNVQPYSGSPANLAVYLATMNPGDTVMGLDLTHGGHLTHGYKVSATGIFYKSFPYHVKTNGRVDFEEVLKLAKLHKPKLIWTGATAYVYEYEFEKFAEIAQKVGAYLAADVAHTAGLIAADAHKNPGKYVDIITTTTHKTLRGPRGAMIMVTNKGIKKDPELPEKINKAVFPGLQGGPHDHTTAAIAVALKEAAKPNFKKYGKQIVKNAKTLAKELINKGFKLVGNGTENHLCLIDLTTIFGPGGGFFMQYALDNSGITLNKNTIPGEPASPFYPSGVRLGTPALTTRGMKEKEMKKIANWIWEVAESIKEYKLPKNKEERIEYLKKFRKEAKTIKTLVKIKKKIKIFASKYPIFA
ncbi:serine hydroxymethyltransferase [Candidatus Roizmanbacteria bacterium RIFCSPHIGHO2_01_FULL_35_10]|uniref:Serine hydroxymethyltransferase n=1 Tax=Candidatus Roizmanbacteria bacterium RIFCSPLOWO2_01_FULL_35_13 TaxID=1802055 RepID=A0A1F7IAQ8_9BACT|nr:MAG: serine hydroxymethyltransferase [Candidatus Roizmanbacteria bacterium RIFCSPHIGHO2_01_FULL_35_10]OGK40422.1 MAG: serine hydroxymethyltransferase [Candidatus Roizmanbacteria bacterium RIFCSPLOWO2_01_FULL_35_13]